MKLSAWAKKHGYSYTGAWLKFKRGGLPGAYQLEDGTILVEEEHNKRRSKRKTELILKELDED